MTIHVSSPPLHSETLAHEWKERYENAYSPFAYGTSLSIKHNPDGTFTVEGHRYHSAD